MLLPGVNDGRHVAIVPVRLSGLFYAPGTPSHRIPVGARLAGECGTPYIARKAGSYSVPFRRLN